MIILTSLQNLKSHDLSLPSLNRKKEISIKNNTGGDWLVLHMRRVAFVVASMLLMDKSVAHLDLDG